MNSTVIIAIAVAIAAGVVFFILRSRRSQTLEVGGQPVRTVAPPPASPPPVSPVRSMPRTQPAGSTADEIEKLWRLKEEGALTAAEFEAQKARLMAGEPGDSVTGGLQVVLLDAGPRKISVIKRVREITQLGLKDAKDLVESPPTVVAEGLTVAQAEAMRAGFEADGARVDVR